MLRGIGRVDGIGHGAMSGIGHDTASWYGRYRFLVSAMRRGMADTASWYGRYRFMVSAMRRVFPLQPLPLPALA